MSSQIDAHSPVVAYFSDDRSAGSIILPVSPPFSDTDECSCVSVEICQQEKRSVFRSLARCFSTAFMLWIIEFCLVLGLKHLGIVDPRFTLDEAVVERMLPQFEDWRMPNVSLPTFSLSYLSKFEAALFDIDPMSYLTNEKKRPGYHLRLKGAQPVYPIVMVPGFVTSGLEVWNGKDCAKKYFRRRLWAALLGARSFLTDTECWKQHMALDPLTGSDPEGIHLRAAQGFEAADYFIVNYWVFGKLIENLADIGYTSSDCSMEPHDWRLSLPLLEKRDGYLTHLKHKIEAMHKITGKRIILISHSMGALLTHHFFTWVTTPEHKGGGNGGYDWVDRHIHAYVNIAGPHLGVPKAATALFSGEMSDTVLGGAVGNMMEQFFGRQSRRDLWATWGSLWSMLPMGGNRIWGTGADLCSSRDHGDPFCSSGKVTPMITISGKPPQEAVCALNPILQHFEEAGNQTVSELVKFIQSFGATYGEKLANARLVSEGRWFDPTITPLPFAPNMKIYCMYGTGVPTERAYHYKVNPHDDRESSGLPLILDDSVVDHGRNTSQGIRYSDGDGSVPLLSLGYICTDAWKRKELGLNPSQIPVFTREYRHSPGFTVDDPMRRGPYSAEHVDILGHQDVMKDLLRIVSDIEIDEVNQNHFESSIVEISNKVNEGGGLQKKFKKKWFG